MITEEELEQRTNDMIDRERIRNAILDFEIENMTKAVEQLENVSGFSTGDSRVQSDGLPH